MIETIKILVPEKTEELEYLLKIIDKCGGKIVFETYAGNNPGVCFYDKEQGQKLFRVGELNIGFNLIKIKTRQTVIKPRLTVLSDKFGEYLQVNWPTTSYYQFNLKQVYRRLSGHIKTLDHTGIDINPKLMAPGQFERLVNTVASSSYLVSHPENENWLFVIPRAKKIGPLLEIVGDAKYDYPEIHVDIQTDLTPKKVIEMFPPPYGYYDPNPKTGDYCVSVFVYTGWNDTSLRVDVRFFVPNFKWKEWLVKEGKRII